MPHDVNGIVLEAGDDVIIRAKVKDVQASEDFCNVNLVTALPMPPYSEGTTLVLNTRQVEKVETPDAAAGA